MNTERLITFIKNKSIHNKFSSLLNLFGYSDALQAILIAQECDIEIWGIDSFRILEDKIQPSWQNSIDFGEERNNHDKAVAFMESKKFSDYPYFEIVFDIYPKG